MKTLAVDRLDDNNFYIYVTLGSLDELFLQHPLTLGNVKELVIELQKLIDDETLL